jgi:hypothetical protein
MSRPFLTRRIYPANSTGAVISNSIQRVAALPDATAFWHGHNIAGVALGENTVTHFTGAARVAVNTIPFAARARRRVGRGLVSGPRYRECVQDAGLSHGCRTSSPTSLTHPFPSALCEVPIHVGEVSM